MRFEQSVNPNTHKQDAAGVTLNPEELPGPDYLTYEGAWFARGQFLQLEEREGPIYAIKSGIDMVLTLIVENGDVSTDDLPAVRNMLKPYEDSYTAWQVGANQQFYYLFLAEIEEVLEKQNITREVVIYDPINAEIYIFDAINAHFSPSEVAKMMFYLYMIDDPDSTVDI